MLNLLPSTLLLWITHDTRLMLLWESITNAYFILLILSVHNSSQDPGHAQYQHSLHWLLTHWFMGFPVSLLAFPGAVVCDLASIAYTNAFLAATVALAPGDSIRNKTNILTRFLQQPNDGVMTCHLGNHKSCKSISWDSILVNSTGDKKLYHLNVTFVTGYE